MLTGSLRHPAPQISFSAASCDNDEFLLRKTTVKTRLTRNRAKVSEQIDGVQHLWMQILQLAPIKIKDMRCHTVRSNALHLLCQRSDLVHTVARQAPRKLITMEFTTLIFKVNIWLCI